MCMTVSYISVLLNKVNIPFNILKGSLNSVCGTIQQKISPSEMVLSRTPLGTEEKKKP